MTTLSSNLTFYIKYGKFVVYVRFYSNYIEILNRGFIEIVKHCEFLACICSKYNGYEEIHFLRLSFTERKLRMLRRFIKAKGNILKYYGKTLSE
jgi:hypothetical protein